MTNLQAALGLAQMEQLETFIEIKIKNYECYHSQISSIPGLSILGFRENTRSNHWFYSVFCDPVYPFDRDSLIHRLGEKKIQCRPIWGLIHQQKPYEGNMSFEIDKALYYNKHIPIEKRS